MARNAHKYTAAYIPFMGAIFKLSRTALRLVADGADWCDVANQLGRPAYNYSTDRWTGLPNTLYSSDERVCSASNSVACHDGDDMDAGLAAWILNQ